MSLTVSRRQFCPKPLRQTITRFKRDFLAQLKRVKAEFKRKDDDLDSGDWELVVKKLAKKWGLKKKYHDGMSGILFISKKKGFVVKRSYLCRDGYRFPKCAIWTKAIPFRSPYDDDSNGPVYVQPIADVSYRAADRAYEAIDDSDVRTSDLHEGNVGIYRGKAVAIDW